MIQNTKLQTHDSGSEGKSDTLKHLKRLKQLQNIQDNNYTRKGFQLSRLNNENHTKKSKMQQYYNKRKTETENNKNEQKTEC